VVRVGPFVVRLEQQEVGQRLLLATGFVEPFNREAHQLRAGVGFDAHAEDDDVGAGDRLHGQIPFALLFAHSAPPLGSASDSSHPTHMDRD
jgi:hypothetical protein